MGCQQICLNEKANNIEITTKVNKHNIRQKKRSTILNSQASQSISKLETVLTQDNEIYMITPKSAFTNEDNLVEANSNKKDTIQYVIN